MPIWVLLVAGASIVVTGVLTLVLWRINLTMLREPNPGPAAPADDDD